MTGETSIDRRTFRYRAGEKRIFLNPESVPDGEGWVDSPAKVGQTPEIKPVAAVSSQAAQSEPQTLPITGESPKRLGRKPRA